MCAFKVFDDERGQVLYVREARNDFVTLTVMVEVNGNTLAGAVDDPAVFDEIDHTNAFELAGVEEMRQALR